jgi:soluble lytic murein transglycosylase
LAAAGLQTWARDRLDSVEAAAKAEGSDGVLALSDVRAAAGDWRGAQALVRSRCPKPGQGDPAMQRRCWPRPLGAAVAPVAARYRVPANLPFAIMTAESALQPEVTSIAGARGLMQLMPALAAQHHAEVYPDRPWHPDRLYDPRVNARLGVHELGTLQAAFGARGVEPALPLVIAGYNAGTAAVDRWLSAAGPEVEADVWAENIGYTETRRYVRRVLGYLRAYELVYGVD